MSVTNYDGRLEAMAGYCQSMYENLAKAEGAYHDSVKEMYSETLPSKFFDFKQIKKVGGRTILMNQINNNNQSTSTVNDVTFTNNGDGSWTVDGTAIANGFKELGKTTVTVGHKFALFGCPNGGSSTTFYLGVNGALIDEGNGGLLTSSITAFNVRLDFKTGASFDNVTIWPLAFDLTVMFGAGNEPASAAAVRQILPGQVYETNTGELLSAGVTEIISKDSDDTTQETFTVPEDITTMEGYGWSCPGAYNYIDFETKQFVQAVGSRAYEAGDESDSTVITDGTNTQYALDEPIAFDVELPDDIITKAEAGGTLTFANKLGEDYCIPVPVELEYIGVS